MAPTPEAIEPQTYSVAEAARRPGISLFLAKKLIRTGELPSFKLGHRRLIPRAAVEAILAAALARGGRDDA